MVNLEKLEKSDQKYKSEQIYYKNMYGSRIRVIIRIVNTVNLSLLYH
jgi:hypothetical protein